MFYHCLKDQKKTPKSYEYKLKSVIKKKLSKLMDMELPLASSLFPNLNLYPAKNSQATRLLNVIDVCSNPALHSLSVVLILFFDEKQTNHPRKEKVAENLVHKSPFLNEKLAWQMFTAVSCTKSQLQSYFVFIVLQKVELHLH